MFSLRYMDTRKCKRCSVYKPLSSFPFYSKHKGTWGYECCQCKNKRDSAVRNASIRRLCDKLILKRQSNGTHFVSDYDYGKHRDLAHMLDAIGRVKTEFKGTYEGLVRLSFEDRLARDVDKYIRKLHREKSKKVLPVSRVLRKRRNPLESGQTVPYILYRRFRSRIRKFVRMYGLDIPKSWYELHGRTVDEYMLDMFGYTGEQLQLQLALQFTEGMDWLVFSEGRIHIDHKSPMGMFDLRTREGIRYCFALNNIQPLMSNENIKKSAWCDLTDTYVVPKYSNRKK